MRAIGGFLVLLGPLVAAVVWLLVCLGVMLLLSRYFKLFKRGGVQLVALFAMFLLLFADEIVGRIYHNYLCSTEAGVKIYQTVELPAEYWDEKGKPKFSVNGGADNRQTLFSMEGKTWEDKRFLYSGFIEKNNQTLHVEKSGFRLSDRETGRVFGEVLYFMYWGGWLTRNFSPHNSAVSCEMKNLDDWKYNVFKPATSTR